MTTVATTSNATATTNSVGVGTTTVTHQTTTNLRSLIPQNCREVGGQAIWMLSSCKSGYGVEQLRDDNTDTYWQSDGPQPHLVNVLFRKKTAVSHLALYTDVKADESYTPNRISIRAGCHASDLTEITQVELKDSVGWTVIPLKTVIPADEGGGPNCTRPIRTFMIQVAVLQNHQNGRDTHVRQIKVFGPGNGRADAAIGGFVNGYGLI